MKVYDRLFVVLFMGVAALIPGGVAAQQTGTISGVVVDETNRRPLAEVSVTVDGTVRRATTGAEGRYTISGVPSGRVELRASRLGYGVRSQPVTVVAGQTATANFSLEPAALEIGGLVVTATGREQRTRELGNAVSVVNVSEDVELAAVNSTAGLLQGRSAGVVVTQSSGTTGAGARVRIRGNTSVSLGNEPLIIIDGVRVSNQVFGSAATVGGSTTIAVGGQTPSRLNDLNPDEIDSIEILKGPAASALYGTAAANGVIQITTKRGLAGQTRWHVYTEQASLEDVIDYPANFAAADNCNVVFGGAGFCDFDPATVISFNPLENPATTPLRKGNRQQYGLSVSGGSDVATYYVAGEVENEDGVYENNYLDKITLRANLTGRPRENLNVRVNTGYISSESNRPQNDNNFFSPLLNALLGPGDTTDVGAFYFFDPKNLAQIQVGEDLTRAIASLNVDYRPASWLSLNTTQGFELLNRQDAQHVPPGLPLLFTSYVEGFRTNNRVESLQITSNANATATFDLRDNIASTTSAGVQFQRERYEDVRAFGQGLTPGVPSLAGATKLFSANENNQENRTLGFYIQEQLAFSDRLFVTGALRADENSAFGVETDLVYYPSVSAAWVLSDESFFPADRLGAISNLRLRAAYGRSGLRPNFRDAITFYSPVVQRINGAEVPAITLGTPSDVTLGTGQPGLRPEIVSEVEAGFDLGLFADRVGLEFTYYNKRSEDALIQRNIAPSLGASSARFENIGSVRNTGIEGAIRANTIAHENLNLEFRLTGSTNENELVRSNVPPIFAGFAAGRQRIQEGFPLGAYFLTPVTFADANGNNMIERSEVTLGDSAVFQGTPFPKREVSLNGDLTLFKSFKVSALLDYKGGHKLLNFTRYDRCLEGVCEELFQSGRLEDQAAYIAANLVPAAQRTTALYLEDADFVKLRELSLSIGLPQRFITRFGADGARLTLAGRNLYTWTDYSGFDPEVNSFGQASFSTADYYTQPPVRYLTARLDLNF